ncbi:flavin reductase family protein [Paeniglutamicibacter sp. ABSL32-1]|jgi:flavin reductase (DIM6/NTAB) family NADH-FMN oxidoreductase RutF|uniref:flavin reductase family protein n=1 Tax=Paeniglutamicibacter TaxID=1742990 RepID=UPI001C2DC1B0|nr:flavin reductase family protein [Paeniglutamicibacter quisquiliarum]MBV1781207.1 flavin reductase family protein [Paeniglutamicibacter quisquiliarum]
MTLTSDLTPDTLRNVFAQHPSGIAALCAIVDGQPQGIIASSFTVGVSMDPPLVMFAVQNTSKTWPLVRTSGRIGVSVLSEKNEGVCRQIASKSGDRFAGLRLDSTDEGALFLHDATLWLDCSVEQEVPAGDHHVVLLRVHGHQTHDNAHSPLVFHGSAFRRLDAEQLVS